MGRLGKFSENPTSEADFEAKSRIMKTLLPLQLRRILASWHDLTRGEPKDEG